MPPASTPSDSSFWILRSSSPVRIRSVMSRLMPVNAVTRPSVSRIGLNVTENHREPFGSFSSRSNRAGSPVSNTWRYCSM